ncbi:MAG: 3-deoxy-D-manno-octulosonic acid transferase [Candidatus Tokpelaia sp.]|uniref:lipid IV(A) 3-deoxy-D-manno-octulosonic acid transferase n=1 Tax=Candidatus Tokpelaia sp. TaxID=2233777 RepID=UPI00123A5665|nr:lipid IV(A) 3-deoxy-D-manno-octulosonic acid transferase [Candidatus Tokpelaia sp.]KAA6205268.1 MAG: 3-deoxy-D-manno-octulosonic acid transferase [Candidatus Tokpelaia sp.]KAA6207493.1 MAG: 3-deoxy-D-manno-octulosonic acid transferase [Candidatus Tokpelaia sp.]KAA6405231.1 3-deoxy-D-manno-octulosonic acid transferase [Candidatus Tokpelaia sp.]
MKKIRARLLFSAYSGLGSCLRLFVPPYLSWRAARGKEELRRYGERLGHASARRPEGALIWLHAASVGETMALIPLCERILAANINIVLTTGTVTSARLVRERFGGRLAHQYVPLDIGIAVRRFLNYWKPDLALVCESEIWPMRIIELARRRIPQILLNARLSDRSFQAWRRRKFFAREIFSCFTEVICQTDEDARRYKMLGAPRVAVAGNLKADIVLPAKNEELEHYRRAIGARPRWAAVSTHEGEELMAARVHRILRKRYPDLLTIIVPRHPERITAIIDRLRSKNYHFVRKSLGEVPGPQTDILLGDTIGDMGLYLRLTEIAFVGKSLAGEGGHNPLEPALAGAAILTGPNIDNFRETYQEFMKNDAARFVDDSTMLAGCVHHLLEHPEMRKKMIASGRKTAQSLSGALRQTFTILKPFLQPLTLAAQLNRANDRHG